MSVKTINGIAAWRRTVAFAWAFVCAAALSPNLSAQTIDVKLTTLQSATGSLPFSSPALGVKGTIRPMPGDRFELVVITLGDRTIVGDVRQFVLVSAGGVSYAPVAIGGGPDLIVPLDCVPLGLEVGQILPSDAILSVKRVSTTSVTIDAKAGVTIALVYQLPEGATVRSFKLPDGRELDLER
jgi:hypothetical protein